jgi:KR domain
VDAWRYQELWKLIPDAFSADAPSGDAVSAVGSSGDAFLGGGSLVGRWLVVVPVGLGGVGCVVDSGWVDGLVGSLGPEVVRVEVGDLGRAGLAEGVGAALAEVGGDFVGVVSLLGLGDLGVDDSVGVAGVAGTACLVQALGDVGVVGRLWAVTCGAVSVGVSDRVGCPRQAGVWGLGRVAAVEYPQLWGGLVDLPRVWDGVVADRFVGVLAGSEDQVAVRAEGVFGRRLVPAPSGLVGGVRRWEPSGTVLLTGGTGALGGHVARWLAGAGVEHLVLASRRGLAAPGAEELVDELVGLGAGVTVVACDVGGVDSGAV